MRMNLKPDASPAALPPHRVRADLRTVRLYAAALLWEFRWTLLVLGLAVGAGGLLYMSTPHGDFGGRPVPGSLAFYYAWMAMLAQPQCKPETWYLTTMCSLYPLLGFVLIGEGIVRLALLMTSRREGEKEWMKVKASTCRDHVVLCGLGHLGFRVLQQLLASRTEVVALEKDANGRFMAQAKATGIPVLVRDMKDDQALIDAGVAHARTIIIASNDDMANLEVALDARRMNPKIRIIMRLFDQQIAAKIAGALDIDAAFSSSALAAPVVAAMSSNTPILAAFPVAGVIHAAAEISVEPQSALDGKTIAEAETLCRLRVVGHLPAGASSVPLPEPGARIASGDKLVVHVASAQLSQAVAAGKSQG